jgi:putative ABC transport system permease protein
MFARLLWKLLLGSSGRLSIAIVAIVSGAAVISALMNLDLGVEYKLTQEFRTLGANLVISPGRFAQSVDAGTASPILMGQDTVMRGIEKTRAPGHVAAAPYLYIVARVGETPVVVAGTWLDEARKLAPTWKLDGSWVASRDDVAYCLVGRNVARQFNLAPGSALNLKYIDSSAQLTVSGVLDSGGPDDNQIFVSLPVVQRLANLRGIEGQIGLVQLSIQGAAAEISTYAAQLAKALPQFEVRPIRQVTEAGGAMLSRIRLLIFSMVLLILVLTALCVLATMAALAMERREDVGLMKALGGSISRIVGLFLAEVGVLGAAGGLIGCMAGVALSHWMGERVFGAAIAARWEVFPLTVGLMVIVALAGALPLRLLGKIKPAVILRGEM